MHVNSRRPWAVGAAVVAALGLALPASAASSGQTPTAKRPTVVLSGLNNPRQLSAAPNGDLILAEAGRGINSPSTCRGTGENRGCIGKSGRVLVIRGSSHHAVLTHLLSEAAADGTFGGGAVGAGRYAGKYFAIDSPIGDVGPFPGFPTWQGGKLLLRLPNGGPKPLADPTKYEANHDPDGEGVDSNPYSVLALNGRVLIADAGGDDILQYSLKSKHLSLWARMKEYGPKVDPVPTVVTKGTDGYIYVGELHSEIPNAARVWRFSPSGRRLSHLDGFTTVTGVAQSRSGTLWVSELFGGSCAFDQIPSCFPGRVVRVATNGHRTYTDVPFPAGIAVSHGKVYVNAFSVSPAQGFGGNPDWSGQLWRLN
jgi:hypothetical protein